MYNESGAQVAKMSVPGGSINQQIASNKSYIYVTVRFEKDNTFQNYIYRYGRKKGKLTKLKKLPEGFIDFYINDLIGDVLYLSGQASSPSKLVGCTYDIKKKKLKKLKAEDVGFDQHYGAYYVMSGKLTAGEFYRYPIYLYQFEKRKATKLCEYSDCYTIIGKYLYYSSAEKKGFAKDSPHQIIRVDLNTGKKLPSILIDVERPS